MDTWRTADENAVTGGCVLFQTAWLINGEITSFVEEDSDKVEKYWNSGTNEVIFKKYPVIKEQFINANQVFYQSDSTGLNFIEKDPGLMVASYQAMAKAGNYFFCVGDGENIYKSLDAETWVLSFDNSSYNFPIGNLVSINDTDLISYQYGLFLYSKDCGVTWNTSSISFSNTPILFFKFDGKLQIISVGYDYGNSVFKISWEQLTDLASTSLDWSRNSSDSFNNIFTIVDYSINGTKIALSTSSESYENKIAVLNNGTPTVDNWSFDTVAYSNVDASALTASIVDANSNYLAIIGGNPVSNGTVPPVAINYVFKNIKNNKYYARGASTIYEASRPNGPWVQKTINVPYTSNWLLNKA